MRSIRIPPHLRGAALAIVGALLLAAPAPAQNSENPLLTISMHVGWLTGPQLWHLGAQPAAVQGGAMDTIGLSRVFQPGFQIGVGATLFRSPHFGIDGDISFLGLTTEGRCSAPPVWAYDANHSNQQACEILQGRAIRTNAVAIRGGVTWRPIATGAVQPYLRVLTGLGLLGNTFVDARAPIGVPNDSQPIVMRDFLSDPNRRVFTWIASLGAGVTLEISPGTLLRFEVRDEAMSLPVVTGPADVTTLEPVAKLGNRIVHLPGFTIGFDIVLEQSQRPRRY